MVGASGAKGDVMVLLVYDPVSGESILSLGSDDPGTPILTDAVRVIAYGEVSIILTAAPDGLTVEYLESPEPQPLRLVAEPAGPRRVHLHFEPIGA